MSVSKPLALVMVLPAVTFAAQTGKINFTGAVTDITCNVTAGGTTNTVILPSVPIKALKGASSTAGKTQFDMDLSGCNSPMSLVTAFFQEGDSVDSQSGRLKNINAMGAKKVTLQLIDGRTHQPIKVGNHAQIQKGNFASIRNGKAHLRYFVQYYAEDAGVTPGAINSLVTYSLTYK